MNDLNTFLKELKTVIETGYTKNGRQFFGTGAGGIFNVKHFDGTDLAFQVQTVKPTRDQLILAPLIAIHTITPNYAGLIGGNRDSYTFNIEIFFTEQEKVVGAETIQKDELARFFLEEMNRAIENCRSQFVTSKVVSLNRLPGITQEGRFNNTTIYGFTARAEVVLG